MKTYVSKTDIIQGVLHFNPVGYARYAGHNDN